MKLTDTTRRNWCVNARAEKTNEAKVVHVMARDRVEAIANARVSLPMKPPRLWHILDAAPAERPSQLTEELRSAALRLRIKNQRLKNHR